MTSTQPNPILSGKANASSSHSPIQQQPPQVTSSGFDANFRRTVGHSPQISFGRNNQTLRKQHKNQRRPRLADEDAMGEAIVRPHYLLTSRKANFKQKAMRNASSRRGQTSITHLMSFNLPPRPQNHHNSIGRGIRRNAAYGLGSGHHAIDKARWARTGN